MFQSPQGFVFVNETKKNLKEGGKEPLVPKGRAWWQPAVEIFSQVSGWIAGPIILALVLGKYLDGRLDTRPWIFITLTIIAFFITSWGIVRIVKKFIKDAENNSDSKLEK